MENNQKKNSQKSQLEHLREYIGKNQKKFDSYKKKIDMNDINYDEFNQLFEGDRFKSSKKHDYLTYFVKIEEKVTDYIINNKMIDYSSYINILKMYSFYLTPKFKVEGLSTSQLRNIFEVAKKTNKVVRKLKINQTELIQKEVNKLIKLRLNLAYLQGKNKGNKIFINFLDILDSFIIKINLSEDKIKEVKNLYEFLEGIVCYLKYFNELEGER